MDDAAIAGQLRDVATLLERQEASPYRVQAYRRAADTIAQLPRPVTAILDAEGLEGLCALPGIDRALASVIAELARTGRLRLLDRLRGTLDVEEMFCTIPGVGPTLARALHDTLHVDTLEALAAAAREGRLREVPGVGPRRAEALAAALALHVPSLPLYAQPSDEPPVELLLSVDEEYRRRAAARELPLIAPRRQNPTGAAWLPVLHTQRGPWHFTALYSNTARAHALGRTFDWVIVYFFDDHHPEHQRTIVTERAGLLKGHRVVRGRERECEDRVLTSMTGARVGALLQQ